MGIGALFTALEVLLSIDAQGLADFEGLLAALIRLTSHSSFVGHHLVALDADAIDGDNITGLEVDDIADLKFLRVKALKLGDTFLIIVTHNVDLKFKSERSAICLEIENSKVVTPDTQ